MTAPHSPGEAKQSDLDHFAHITDPTERIFAAMNYAMDRSVGKVRNALAANNLDDNTIIVFLNDNGGTPFNDNQPLNGYKGLAWEGGIRVPMFVKAPGLQAGTFDAPYLELDLLPTVYAAAGGDVSQLNAEGVDLMPHFSGANSNNPHELLYWRNGAQWAVRKGEWKLGNPDGSTGTVLFNIALDQSETTNVASQNPAIVTDLLRAFTDWEVENHKPYWGFEPFIAPYDHFVYRTDNLPSNPNVFHSFTSGAIWRDAVSGAVAAVNRADSYANLKLEFPVQAGRQLLCRLQHSATDPTDFHAERSLLFRRFYRDFQLQRQPAARRAQCPPSCLCKISKATVRRFA